MSLIIKEYQNGVEKCWYDSSNILYSELYDKKDEYKDLKVVFKNSAYLYKNIPVQNYLLFREDISQGKALSKYISLKNSDGKFKFEYEKTDLPDLKLLSEEKEKLIQEKKVILEKNNEQ